MTLLVRDEEDILRDNIEYHFSQGVDFIIATDNRSVDSTKDILMEYQRKGKLLYIYEGDDTYNQHAWVTSMACIAYREHEADWVINNDADEFWWPFERNLKDAFLSLDDKINVVRVSRYDYVLHDQINKDIPFYQTMNYKNLYSKNALGKPLPGKVAHKGSAEVAVKQGNHNVDGLGKLVVADNVMEILHFPIRSKKQFLNKISLGGAAYARNEELDKNIGLTWRVLYEKLKEEGNLDSFLEEVLYSQSKLSQAIKEGVIIKALKLSNYFNKINGIRP